MKRPLSEEQKKQRAKYAREWRRKNPDRAREHARRTREKNKDKIRWRQRRWASENQEHVQESGRDHYLRNRDRIRERNWLKTFRITADQYHAMLEAQGGGCAICGSKTPGKGEFFAVDHDHITGLIRGLLCVHCNVGLGHFKDSPALLERAIMYLRSQTGTAAPQGTSARPTSP